MKYININFTDLNSSKIHKIYIIKENMFRKIAKTMCVGCQKGFWVIFSTNKYHLWYLLGVKSYLLR